MAPSRATNRRVHLQARYGGKNFFFSSELLQLSGYRSKKRLERLPLSISYFCYSGCLWSVSVEEEQNRQTNEVLDLLGLKSPKLYAQYQRSIFLLSKSCFSFLPFYRISLKRRQEPHCTLAPDRQWRYVVCYWPRSGKSTVSASMASSLYSPSAEMADDFSRTDSCQHFITVAAGAS